MIGEIIFIADAWGAKHGGINSFNEDLCLALAKLLGDQCRIGCVVLDATFEEINSAKDKGVCLITLDPSKNKETIEDHRIYEILNKVKDHNFCNVLWWIGHDVITGNLAIKASKLFESGQSGKSAVIHHMNYEAYMSYKESYSENEGHLKKESKIAETQKKIERQMEILSNADIVFAVGPKLYESAYDKLGDHKEIKIVELIPGLAEIEGSRSPKTFSAITYGRLDPRNDRVKQARLAVAAFGKAKSMKIDFLGDDAKLFIIGLSKDKQQKEYFEILRLAEKKAGKVFPIQGWSYIDDRNRLFNHLRHQSVCLMLSLHEGFGLVGWEAIAAEVPLIVSKNSGLYLTIEKLLGGSGTGCLKPISLEGSYGDESYTDEDVENVANLLIEIKNGGEKAKQDAKNLKDRLKDKCTWQATASTIATEFGLKFTSPSNSKDVISQSTQLIPDEVRIINPNLFINKASKEDIKQYYDGAKLTWEIVASDTAIIERDAYKQLVKEWISPTEFINMICVVGDAGEGKSSLAWKFIYNLAQNQDSLILQIKDFENPQIWYKFENIYNQVQKPIIVLVDNVFRNDQVVAAMQSMEVLHIPITILATSRTNEYRDRANLPFNVKRITLNKPSYEEKKRILEGLEKNEMKFADIKKDLLEESVPFLVFMIQVTHGKKFEDYIEDEIKRLQKLDPVIYEAYQFLCITYQYEISIPNSLLERIDKKFYNITNEKCHSASRGIILTDDILVDNLRTRHPLISKYSAEYFNQINILIEMINAVDNKSSVERKTISLLFRQMANARDSNLFKIIKQCNNKIEEYHKNATISEMSYWRFIYKKINLDDKASQCVDLALSKFPNEPFDCIWLAKFYQEKNEEIKALPKIQEWLVGNPHDNFVRPALLGLVERMGTPEQKKKAIIDTDKWLSENPKDSHVRACYLGLVESIGTSEQMKKTIIDTDKWLSENPKDSHVRASYLGLVERIGTPEQMKKAIIDTDKWLSEHPLDTNVRSSYLGLVERMGTPEQKKKAIIDTDKWLSKNPKDAHVRASY